MAMQLFNRWDQPEAEDRLELVFEDRFKGYGAYFVRSKYRMAKVWATLIASAVMFFAAATPLAVQLWGKGNKGSTKKVIVKAMTIDDLEEKEEKKDEPEPPKMDIIKEIASQQYTVPEIDPSTTNEAELPPVNQVSNPGASTKLGGTDYFPDNTSNSSGPFKGSGDGGKIVEAEIKAHFRGGDEEFIKYVQSHFEYPPRCQDEGINGYVKLRFVVDGTGAISQVKAIQETKACPEFTQEAIRVLTKSPRWVPGMTGGRYVNSWREIPISLSLSPN